MVLFSEFLYLRRQNEMIYSVRKFHADIIRDYILYNMTSIWWWLVGAKPKFVNWKICWDYKFALGLTFILNAICASSFSSTWICNLPMKFLVRESTRFSSNLVWRIPAVQKRCDASSCCWCDWKFSWQFNTRQFGFSHLEQCTSCIPYCLEFKEVHNLPSPVVKYDASVRRNG